MDWLIILVAKYVIIVPVLVIGYLFVSQKKPKKKEMLILLICGGLLSLLLSRLASQVYFQARPFIGDNIKPLFTASGINGFPSDHTLLASFLGFAALKYSKRLGAAILFLAALIGWARVAAGVHHATDIIGAFIITAVAIFAVSAVLAKTVRHPKAVRHTPDERA